MTALKAEDIGSFDVTPSWERPPAPAQEPVEPLRQDVGCRCGLCMLAAGGHL